MTNKQVESCFLNHNSSIHFCCTDSWLMTHRSGLSLSIIIWRIGGGIKYPFALGPKYSLGGPDYRIYQFGEMYLLDPPPFFSTFKMFNTLLFVFFLPKPLTCEISPYINKKIINNGFINRLTFF